MQISKLENDKKSGKLNLEALKRKNYKSKSPSPDKREVPNTSIQPPVITSDRKKK